MYFYTSRCESSFKRTNFHFRLQNQLYVHQLGFFNQPIGYIELYKELVDCTKGTAIFSKEQRTYKRLKKKKKTHKIIENIYKFFLRRCYDDDRYEKRISEIRIHVREKKNRYF